MTWTFSKRSVDRLIGVHPDLVKVCRRALRLSTVDFGITEGRRTAAKQNKLVAAGASQTMNSRHLTGHAVDVAAYIGRGVRWDWGLYARIAAAFRQASQELGIPIVWGGSWRTLKDGCHFELRRKEYPAERRVA